MVFQILKNEKMTITKIQFSKTIESSVLGAGVWVKIGLESEVEPSDNVENCIDILKQTIDGSHEKYMPQKATGDIYFNVSTMKNE